MLTSFGSSANSCARMLVSGVLGKPWSGLSWLMAGALMALPAQAQPQDEQTPQVEAQTLPSEAPASEPEPTSAPAATSEPAPACPPVPSCVTGAASAPLAPLPIPSRSRLAEARERGDVLRVRVARTSEELRDVRALNREAGPTAPAKALMFAGAGVTAVGVGAYLLAIMPHGNPEEARALFRVSAIAHGVGIPLALAGLGWLRRQQRKQPFRVAELQLGRELKTLRNEHQHVRREIRRLETFGPSASFDRHGARLGLRFQF